MCTNNFFVDVAQRFIRQAKLLRQVAPQVVEHALGGAREVAEHGAALRMLQVERDGALVPVEGLEELAVAPGEEMRTDLAAHVAALAQVLHLDHLGAEVGEVEGARRPGAVLLHREHADAFERQAHAASLPASVRESNFSRLRTASRIAAESE